MQKKPNKIRFDSYARFRSSAVRPTSSAPLPNRHQRQRHQCDCQFGNNDSCCHTMLHSERRHSEVTAAAKSSKPSGIPALASSASRSDPPGQHAKGSFLSLPGNPDEQCAAKAASAAKNTLTKSGGNGARKPGAMPSYLRRPSRIIMEAQLIDKQRRFDSAKQTLCVARDTYNAELHVLRQFQRRLRHHGWVEKLRDLDGADVEAMSSMGNLLFGDQAANANANSLEKMSVKSHTFSELLPWKCGTEFPDCVQGLFVQLYADLTGAFERQKAVETEDSGVEIELSTMRAVQTLEQNVQKLIAQLAVKPATHGNEVDGVMSQDSLQTPPAGKRIPKSPCTSLACTTQAPIEIAGESQLWQEKYSRLERIIGQICSDQERVLGAMTGLELRTQAMEEREAEPPPEPPQQQPPHMTSTGTSISSCELLRSASLADPLADPLAVAIHQSPSLQAPAAQRASRRALHSLLCTRTRQLREKRSAVKQMGHEFHKQFKWMLQHNSALLHDNRQLSGTAATQAATIAELKLNADQLKAECEEHCRTIAVHQRILRVRCELLDLIKSKSQAATAAAANAAAGQPCVLADLYDEVSSNSSALEQLRFEISARTEEMCNLFSTLSDKHRYVLRQREIIRELEVSHERNVQQRQAQLQRITLLEREVASLRMQLHERQQQQQGWQALAEEPHEPREEGAELEDGAAMGDEELRAGVDGTGGAGGECKADGSTGVRSLNNSIEYVMHAQCAVRTCKKRRQVVKLTM